MICPNCGKMLDEIEHGKFECDNCGYEQ